jgi:flagellar biogenesis protein FliO
MPLILALFGILGITVDLIFLLAFFVVLGYYLYRVEKRLSALESNAGIGQQSKSEKDQPPAK